MSVLSEFKFHPQIGLVIVGEQRSQFVLGLFGGEEHRPTERAFVVVVVPAAPGGDAGGAAAVVAGQADLAFCDAGRRVERVVRLQADHAAGGGGGGDAVLGGGEEVVEECGGHGGGGDGDGGICVGLEMKPDMLRRAG